MRSRRCPSLLPRPIGANVQPLPPPRGCGATRISMLPSGVQILQAWTICPAKGRSSELSPCPPGRYLSIPSFPVVGTVMVFCHHPCLDRHPTCFAATQKDLPPDNRHGDSRRRLVYKNHVCVVHFETIRSDGTHPGLKEEPILLRDRFPRQDPDIHIRHGGGRAIQLGPEEVDDVQRQILDIPDEVLFLRHRQGILRRPI